MPSKKAVLLTVAASVAILMVLAASRVYKESTIKPNALVKYGFVLKSSIELYDARAEAYVANVLIDDVKKTFIK